MNCCEYEPWGQGCGTFSTFCHFLSLRARGGIQTIDLRIKSQVFYQRATAISHLFRLTICNNKLERLTLRRHLFLTLWFRKS